MNIINDLFKTKLSLAIATEEKDRDWAYDSNDIDTLNYCIGRISAFQEVQNWIQEMEEHCE